MTDDEFDPFRWRADLETYPGQTPDVDGRIGAPAARVVDTLDILHRNGTLEDKPYAAGLKFRECFDRAWLHGIAAASLHRCPGNGCRAELPDTILGAREAVWRALWALKGPFTPIGSAAWHVIGRGETITKFAAETQWGRYGGSMSRNRAQELVVGACVVFEGHFGL